MTCKKGVPIILALPDWKGDCVAVEEMAALEMRLRKAASEVRMHALEMVHHARVGHPGGDLSAADILVTLYLAVMKIDAKNPRWAERDRFVMSKGHCSGSLYATLAQAGFMRCGCVEDLYGSALEVEWASGPQQGGWRGGEYRAVGAWAADCYGSGAFCEDTGRGVANFCAGRRWRAAGGKQLGGGDDGDDYGLDNLVLIVDRNRIQQGDFTEKTIKMDPLPEKFEAFGWAVEQVDGHDYGALLDVFGRAPLQPGKPTCVIANTVKGRGVSFMENKPEWHHGVPTRSRWRRHEWS